jgi:hypothetical protein
MKPHRSLKSHCERDIHKAKPASPMKRAFPPADIEITPAMVDAGAIAVGLYHPDHESDEDAAIRIYVVMRNAQ